MVHKKHRRQMKRVAKGMGAGLAAALLVATPLMAQDEVTKEAQEEVSKKSSTSSSKAEKIKVTGSRISRTDQEGVSPVVTIDRDAIEKSGVSTVSELLQNMSISSQGSYASSVVNDTRGTVTNVNLRGLGASNTLVLLDGYRIPDEGGQGVIDLSTIPMGAVERIEVLKDSASAIYGSDATGGVVNIITRKDLEGSVVMARTSDPRGNGGQESEFNYVTGTTTKNFRSFTMLSYRKVEPVFYRDREWTKIGLSKYASPANYYEGSEFKVHENCPKDMQSELEGINSCAYNYGATSAFSPKSSQIGVLNNMEYQMNSNIALFSSVRATKSNNLWNMAPNAGAFTITKDVANANLKTLGLSAPVEKDLTVTYRATPWGLRIYDEESTSVGGNAGVKGSVGYGWDWSVTAGHTQADKHLTNSSGFMLKDRMENAVSLAQFDPFSTKLTEESQAVVDSSRYVPFEITNSQASTYNVDVSGELFDLPGGAAGLALGASRLEQGYEKSYDPQTESDNVFGVEENKSGQGEREVTAAYVEFGLPLASQFEMQLAARHDYYSDFGSTTNPKVGFRYLPASNWLLRGGYGTGFKAPTLAELHRGTTIGLVDLDDQIRCGGPCNKVTTEVEVRTKGNVDLKEETSETFTLGTVLEPFAGFSLGMDYWYIKINDIVTELEAQDVIDATAKGQSFDGVVIERYDNDPNGELKSMDLPTMNLGKREDSGVDLNANYKLRMGADQLALNTDYSRKFYSKQIKFPGQAQENTIGEYGEPLWRAANTVSYTLALAHTVSLRQNLIGSHQTQNRQTQSDGTDQFGQIDEFKTYDLQYAWAHPWNGSLAVGTLNVLDTGFPIDRSQADLRGDGIRRQELYSANGRVLYVKAEQVF